MTVTIDPAALPHRQACEVVERKGLGHPDTLADGIAERASIRYSQYCLQQFGSVLHHNLDKVAVLGGLARFDWRGGEFLRPLRVVFAGRASTSFAGQDIPFREILEDAAREQLAQALPGYDHVPVSFLHHTTDSSKFERWFRPRDLGDLPERARARSNDTALLVGASPYTLAEALALAVESYLASLEWVGSDIKALVVRQGEDCTITAGAPALAGRLGSAAEYRERVGAAQQHLSALLGDYVPGRLTLLVNTGEDAGGGDGRVQGGYVTLSGSAIDYGEDGLVGRGNGRHGLVSPHHQAGNETLFGKNPTYHVGKVAGLLADRLAAAVAGHGTHCRASLVYDKGSSYDQPRWCQLTATDPLDTAAAQDLARRVLARGSWLHDLVDRERYLPRARPLPTLLGLLRGAL